MSYSTGDIVIITGNTKLLHHHYKIGDICRVEDAPNSMAPGLSRLSRLSDELSQFVNSYNFKPYIPSNPKPEEVNTMQTNFNIGDKIITHARHDKECTSEITHIYSSRAVETKDCSLCHSDHWLKVSDITLISPAYKPMDKYLNQLTKEQKSILSKEDQALIELGIITSSLTLSDTSYVIDFLFEQNRAEIAKQAMEEVAEIKAKKEAAKV